MGLISVIRSLDHAPPLRSPFSFSGFQSNGINSSSILYRHISSEQWGSQERLDREGFTAQCDHIRLGEASKAPMCLESAPMNFEGSFCHPPVTAHRASKYRGMD